jgi:HAMP domain-containing protein
MQTTENQTQLNWYQKIGNKIILTTILAGILPLLLLGGTVASKVQNDLLKQAINSQESRTKALSQGIASLLSSYQEQMKILADSPLIQGMNQEKQLIEIHDFLDRHPYFFSCFIFKPNGDVQCMTLRNRRAPDPESGKNPFHDKSAEASFSASAIKKVLSTGKPAFASRLISSFDQKMFLVMVPIFDFADKNLVVGVMSCAISLSDPQIHEIIAEFPSDANDVLALLDLNGRLISGSSSIPANISGIKLPKTLQGENLSNPILIDLASTTYLGTLAHFSQINGYLLAVRPKNKILGFLSQFLFDMAFVMAVAVIISIFFGFILSRSLALGINTLLDGIRRVSQGIVNHRVEIDGEDELAETGNAFNEMVANLEKHRIMEKIWTKEWNSDQDSDREK